MYSFIDLDRTLSGQPRELGALLARIDTSRGQERLFGDQMPELLHSLSEHARIASITASNAIEGVIVSEDRAERIAEGGADFAIATSGSSRVTETRSTCSCACASMSRWAPRWCCTSIACSSSTQMGAGVISR